jgi:hypothetical protein
MLWRDDYMTLGYYSSFSCFHSIISLSYEVTRATAYGVELLRGNVLVVHSPVIGV